MNSDVISKTILILILLIIIQILQYYDDPFLNSHLKQLEFESFLSLFSILLLALYSYCMDNYTLTIFLLFAMLLIYLKFLFSSLKILVYFQIKKLLKHKKFQNSLLFQKTHNLLEKTGICNFSFNFLIYFYIVQKLTYHLSELNEKSNKTEAILLNSNQTLEKSEKIINDFDIIIENNANNSDKEIIEMQRKEIESLKKTIISLQNQIKTQEKSKISLKEKFKNLDIIPDEFEIIKTPATNKIFDDEDEIMTSHNIEKPPKKVNWPISKDELCQKINLNESGSKTININFKKESIFNENIDLNLKICSKKITSFIELNDENELQDFEIITSCSNGIYFYNIFLYFSPL